MIENPKYVEGSDICEVVPSLGVDVVKAVETGIIKDTGARVFHNMMQELGEVGIVARDQFDIIEYERSYAKFRKYVNDEEGKKKEL